MLNALSFQDYSNGSDPGLWYEVYSGSQCLAGRPALFLDRDGVVVEDTQYLGRAQDVRMLAGAGEAIARCNTLGIPVVLVSNQSGIARGLYDWSGFAAVQAAIASALAESRRAARCGLCLRAPCRRQGAAQYCRSSLAEAKSGHDHCGSGADEA